MKSIGSANLPAIGGDDAFVKVVKLLSNFIVDEINSPHTFEQLRTTSAGNPIRKLTEYLVRNITNPALINALLTLKWHFSTLEVDDRGINETRACACEIVAWRFLTRISERDAVDYCLYELPASNNSPRETSDTENGVDASERSALLPQFRAPDCTTIRPGSKRLKLLRSVSHIGGRASCDDSEDDDEEDPTSSFTGLNGLEIAAVADCKKFLSQRIVQKIITGIWNGDITFWESLAVNTTKKPQFWRKKHSDIFTRLRVPRYIKAFEVLFFATFLFLYYAVLVERNSMKITPIEIALYVWFAAFAYDELGEFIDAGSIFYAVDIWNGCDIIIILIGVAFLVARIIGLFNGDSDTAFDILSLEALFMVPRICSLLSLHPYFGTLIPCLKEMAKDFVKFMVVVAILYIGFLTTFSLLARDSFTLSYMSWILIKVFFGSSYLGFDIAEQINPTLGPPLMLIFVTMTNILLVTSLISILSNSFSRVFSHAREEYLFVYSVYVLEASTSNRLTHFYPPLNLIPLIFIRPLRLFVAADKLRSARIVLLKATHLPIVAAIWAFEQLNDQLSASGAASFSSKGPGPLLSDPHLSHSHNHNHSHNHSPSPSRHRNGNENSPLISPPKRQRPFLSNRNSGKTSSAHFTDFPGPVDGGGEDGRNTPLAKQYATVTGNDGSDERVMYVRDLNSAVGIGSDGGVGERENELREEVRELGNKIAELTALMLAQQGASNEE